MAKTTSNLKLFDFISSPLSYYSAVGVKMFKWDDSDYMTTREKCLFVLCAFNLTFNFIAKSSFIVFGEFVDTVHLTKWVLYISFASNGLCKMVSVALGRKKLYIVLKDIEKIFPKSQEERRDFRLLECYNYIMRHTKFMSMQHFAIAIMFVSFPMVESTIEYIINRGDENRQFEPRTPYIMVYPFDTSSGFGYIFVYMSQLLGGVTVSCHLVGSDMLLMCSIYLVIMQYDYLCHRIEHFKSKDYEQDMKEIREVLERHDLLNK